MTDLLPEMQWGTAELAQNILGEAYVRFHPWPYAVVRGDGYDMNFFADMHLALHEKMRTSLEEVPRKRVEQNQRDTISQSPPEPLCGALCALVFCIQEVHWGHWGLAGLHQLSLEKYLRESEKISGEKTAKVVKHWLTQLDAH